MVRWVQALVFGLVLASASAPAQMVEGPDGEEFISALREGNGSKALELIEKPGSTVVNYRGFDGSTGLHIAMRNRNANWVGFLLNKGADPDMQDKSGDTPLILAARLGFPEGAARMLMARAKVDETNKMGETALMIGVQQRQPGIVKMLLEAGADPDKTDHASGYSARDYAKRDSRSSEMLRLIESVKSKKAAVVGPVRP